MRNRLASLFAIASALLLTEALSSASAAAAASKRLLVESVQEGGGAARAGLRAGDRLLSWRCDGRSGRFDTYSDWSRVLTEEVPRGCLVLGVVGESGRRELALAPASAGASVRPALRGSQEREFVEGKARAEAKDTAGAAALWDGVAARLEARRSWDDACWLHMRTAQAWEGKKDWARARASWDLAVKDAGRAESPDAIFAAREGLALEGASSEDLAGAAAELESLEAYARANFGESLRLARAIHLRGYTAWRRGRLEEAEAHYLRALPLRERLSPESQDTAATLNNLGIVYDDRGDLDRSLSFYDRAFALKEKLEPGSLSATMTLNNLGVLSQRRGDLAAAERYFDQALERYGKLEPGGGRYASTLSNLGKLYRERGDLPRAEEALRRALELKEKLAPGSQSHAASLLSLGVLCQVRGDLDAAQEYYRRSLEIKRRVEPESLSTALLLNNLGLLALDRTDYPGAESWYRQALSLIEKQAPEGPDAALVLSNLSVAVGRMGRQEEAEALQKKSYALRKAQAPDGLDTADSLINLSWLARGRGALKEARSLGEQALEIQRRAAPGCLHEGSAHLNLAMVLRQRGDLAAAEGELCAAASRFHDLAPGSTKEAEALYVLGSVQRDAGRKEEAAASLFKALEALESQRDRLGGTEDERSEFSAQFIDYYRDLIQLLLELKRDREAYCVLERSRARGLLALLSRRDLALDRDLPAELERERRELAVKYDQALQDLGTLRAGVGAEAMEKARAGLDDLRRQREELADRIAKASPRLAALRYPRTLDVEGALDALDPGTVLLAYSIGPRRSALFVLGPGRAFRAHALPFGEETLGLEVRRFKGLLEDLVDSRPYAAALGAKLLGPAKGEIVGARRLLVSPDGSLHTLPFAALADPASGGPSKLMAQVVPIHTVLSATLYAELQGGRREGRERTLAAFGDPVYRASGDARGRLRGGVELVPLPGTRSEVEGIGGLFPGGARLLLGAGATEGATKSLDRGTAMVHFACHGILDGDFPLDSALALSVPETQGDGAENGFLQAWEIFESVRVDADLVTLSACETGLGREMGGEGLVGLTRAFQYAGARTVLASLWKVPDAATAELMRRFYAGLKAGLPKDEALRRAQAEFLAGPVALPGPEGETRSADLSRPFYWAGFVLAGDWR